MNDDLKFLKRIHAAEQLALRLRHIFEKYRNGWISAKDADGLQRQASDEYNAKMEDLR